MITLSDGDRQTRLHISGALIDMDGTLVDSHAAVEREWRRWAIEHDVDADAVVQVCHGATAEGTMLRFRPDLDEETVIREAAEHMERETRDVAGIVALPGAARLIETLDELDLPWVLVTNAGRRLAQLRTQAAGIVPPIYATVDEVETGKPDPALYELGAQRLGLRPQECLVIEDSASGVAAGHACGATVAALRRDDGDLRFENLDELCDWLLSGR